jgi:hypothetical protein
MTGILPASSMLKRKGRAVPDSIEIVAAVGWNVTGADAGSEIGVVANDGGAAALLVAQSAFGCGPSAT